MRALIFAVDPRRPWLVQRTQRSLRAAGFEDIEELADGTNTERLRSSGTLLIRAGAWLRQPLKFLPPPPSGAGKPLVAFGFPVGGGHRETWQQFFQKHGGDFSHALQLPPCLCEWYDEHAVRAGLLTERLAGLEGLARTAPSRVRRLVPMRWRRVAHRLIHWSALDCGHDEHLRALEVVTSLQHGGAERIAWELHRLLPQHGVASRLVVLGSPLRRELPRPSSLVDLAGLNRERRAAAMEEASLNFGADVLHGHLIDAEDTRLFSKVLPVVLTIHNARQAWPEGTEGMHKDDCTLLLACAQMVERELKEALPQIPVRTVWNGIDTHRFTPRERSGSGARETLSLVCVANPRHQKRLHLLPGILKATHQELAKRGLEITARLTLAGEASPRSPQALECMAQFQEECVRHGVSDDIIFTHGSRAVEEVLSESDVMISCSAYEGLSLAHLEGLAAGLSLVTTDAGGTGELAWRNPAVTVLPLDAPAREFGRAAVEAFLNPTQGRAEMERHFSASAMARRTASMLRQAASGSARGETETVWFVTNNLSTGGAQSSLKRLATAFLRQGIPVRLALLQEHAEHPTPGRLEAVDAGVPVFVPPPVGKVDTADTVASILEEMNAHPPRSVCFWNAIPACKILIADALWNVPVFDVSPGEMYYTSLERCFENPPPALPYRKAEEYGSRLSKVVVKYAAEANRACRTLGTAVKVIPNGVTLPALPDRRRGDTMPFRIGTAARLSPQKRIEDLIEAFRRALPQVPSSCELLVAGDAETGSEAYAETLRHGAADLPVRWLGELRDLAEFHASLDVFAMISEPAGCPNASLEAMASGLPLVATDVGGASEQVVDGVTGRLVPPRDAGAFARALVEVCGSPVLRASMGRAGRVHAEEHFSMGRMVAAYRAVLWDGPQVAESALAAGAFPVFSSLHP